MFISQIYVLINAEQGMIQCITFGNNKFRKFYSSSALRIGTIKTVCISVKIIKNSIARNDDIENTG